MEPVHLIEYLISAFNDNKTTTSSSSDQNMSAMLTGVLIPLCLVIIAIFAFVVYRRIVRRKSHIRNFHRPPHITCCCTKPCICVRSSTLSPTLRQQYSSYIVSVNFIGGRNRSIRIKPPTCCQSLTIFII